jgi:hypothetical protein
MKALNPENTLKPAAGQLTYQRGGDFLRRDGENFSRTGGSGCLPDSFFVYRCNVSANYSSYSLNPFFEFVMMNQIRGKRYHWHRKFRRSSNKF